MEEFQFFFKKYSSFWKNDGEILLNCSIKLKKVTVAITPYISPYWLLTFQVILFLCIMHINPIMLLNISARTTLHYTLPLAFCCTIHVHMMTLNTLNDQKNSFNFYKIVEGWLTFSSNSSDFLNLDCTNDYSLKILHMTI